MNPLKNETFQYMCRYLQYYIDYLLVTGYNVCKLVCIGIGILLLLPIPPVLWKVTAFLQSIARGETVITAIAESKFASCPVPTKNEV